MIVIYVYYTLITITYLKQGTKLILQDHLLTYIKRHLKLQSYLD